MEPSPQDNVMVRKQYHLSRQNVRRLEQVRDELGLTSEAEVIRRAIDAFEPDALAASDRELVEATARGLIARVHALNAAVDATLERAQAARERIADPAWVESIRARTRREAVGDPALLAGVAKLLGA